jgi:hypothetical protein
VLHRHPDQLEDRRGQVDQADALGDTAAGRNLSRPADEQRDAQAIVIRVRAVLEVVVVLAERLTVIRRQHEHHAIPEAACAERVDHGADLVVRVPDGRIVAGAVVGGRTLPSTAW